MGVVQSAVSMWETDRWEPTTRNVRRAAEILEVPVTWLLGDEPSSRGQAG